MVALVLVHTRAFACVRARARVRACECLRVRAGQGQRCDGMGKITAAVG
jgi:hypothetical protein